MDIFFIYLYESVKYIIFVHMYIYFLRNTHNVYISYHVYS